MGMTLDEIRAASAQQFRQEKAGAAEITETTPPTITEAITRFTATLGGAAPVFVPVIQDEHGLYGWCSDGVREKVRAAGGSIAFGWTIWEWPSVMLTAEFHAVWRDDAGALFDITPKPAGQKRILFVYDLSYAQDFNFDERPRNRRVRLHVEPDRSAELAAVKSALNGGKQRYEEGRAAKAGVTLDEWLAKKLAPDALAEAIDELIAVCGAFEAHFDSLGVAGTIAVDSKFKTLALRRLAVQERMKKLLKANLSDG